MRTVLLMRKPSVKPQVCMRDSSVQHISLKIAAHGILSGVLCRA